MNFFQNLFALIGLLIMGAVAILVIVMIMIVLPFLFVLAVILDLVMLFPGKEEKVFKHIH